MAQYIQAYFYMQDLKKNDIHLECNQQIVLTISNILLDNASNISTVKAVSFIDAFGFFSE